MLTTPNFSSSAMNKNSFELLDAYRSRVLAVVDNHPQSKTLDFLLDSPLIEYMNAQEKVEFNAQVTHFSASQYADYSIEDCRKIERLKAALGIELDEAFYMRDIAEKSFSAQTDRGLVTFVSPAHFAELLKVDDARRIPFVLPVWSLIWREIGSKHTSDESPEPLPREITKCADKIRETLNLRASRMLTPAKRGEKTEGVLIPAFKGILPDYVAARLIFQESLRAFGFGYFELADTLAALVTSRVECEPADFRVELFYFSFMKTMYSRLGYQLPPSLPSLQKITLTAIRGNINKDECDSDFLLAWNYLQDAQLPQVSRADAYSRILSEIEQPGNKTTLLGLALRMDLQQLAMRLGRKEHVERSAAYLIRLINANAPITPLAIRLLQESARIGYQIDAPKIQELAAENLLAVGENHINIADEASLIQLGTAK